MTASRRLAAVTLCALVLPLPGPARSDVSAGLVGGDTAWQRRAEGHLDGVPRPGPIREAIAAYEAALVAHPEDLEVRWKLQRALYFEGEYAASDQTERLAAFLRGRDVGEEGLDLLAAALGGRETLDTLEPSELARRLPRPREFAPGSFSGPSHLRIYSPARVLGQAPSRRPLARLYFWTAVHWGLWGRAAGKLRAVRQGVATTVRDYAERVIALDEQVEGAGGHRLLGRLHFEAPKVPLFTGWVSKERAVAELTFAHRLAPEDALTKVYLAEALLERGRSRRKEALELLRDVATTPPAAEFVVEELRAIRDARRLLARAEP